MKILRESAQVNTAAEKDYLDGLKQGYIDIDAFHLAYDDIIKDAGQTYEDLFYKRGDKVLKKRSSYGDIKAARNYNKPLYDALVSLWLAQFKDGLPLKKNIVVQQATSTGSTKMTKREELTKQAVDMLNKAKGINYVLEDIKEGNDGTVSFVCHYPSGYVQVWWWPACWFDPAWELTEITGLKDSGKEELKQINKFSGEAKVVARMMAYLWSVRNFRG